MIRIAHSRESSIAMLLAMPVAIFFSVESTNVTRMETDLAWTNYISKVCDVNQDPVNSSLASGLELTYQRPERELLLKMKRVPYTNLSWSMRLPSSAHSSPSCLEGNFYDAIG